MNAGLESWLFGMSLGASALDGMLGMASGIFIVLAATTFGSALLYAISGFGFAVLAAPLFLLFLDPARAIQLVIIISTHAAIPAIGREGRFLTPSDRGDPLTKRKDRVNVLVEFKMIAIRCGTQRLRYRRAMPQRRAGGAVAVLVGVRRSGRQPEPSGGEKVSMDAMVSISKRIRSGGHWNSNLSPIIAQQRREPGCSRRKPQRPGSKIILGR